MEDRKIYNIYFGENSLGTFYGDNVSCLKDVIAKKYSFEERKISVVEVDKYDNFLRNVGCYDKNGWTIYEE